MNTAPQELLKEYVKSQRFTALRKYGGDEGNVPGMFRRAMEVELDEELGGSAASRARVERAQLRKATPRDR